MVSSQMENILKYATTGEINSNQTGGVKPEGMNRKKKYTTVDEKFPIFNMSLPARSSNSDEMSVETRTKDKNPSFLRGLIKKTSNRSINNTMKNAAARMAAEVAPTKEGKRKYEEYKWMRKAKKNVSSDAAAATALATAAEAKYDGTSDINRMMMELNRALPEMNDIAEDDMAEDDMAEDEKNTLKQQQYYRFVVPTYLANMVRKQQELARMRLAPQDVRVDLAGYKRKTSKKIRKHHSLRKKHRKRRTRKTRRTRRH
jgi:uncharacterized tellurite resistance protein B-like protein